MAHGLTEYHFRTFEEVKEWVHEWFASKDKQFYWGLEPICVALPHHFTSQTGPPTYTVVLFV